MAQATLYNPHEKQREIHNSINNDDCKYYVLNIGRQFGKTLLATNQLLYWCLNNKNVRCAWVSPVYKQSKKVFKECHKAFQKRPQIYRNVNSSELILEYITGSSIQFFSSERYDNIRGFTFDYLVCDEFAFMDSEAWSEVLRATVLVKGKKVILISTPKGKNHFYQMHQLDGVNPQYKSFTMTSYENPLINPKEIDDAKLTLPDHIFRQEYLAEFIDGGGSIFTDLNFNEFPKTDTRYFAGLDVARADDYTVISVFNTFGEQVFIERYRHDSWATITDKVAEVIKKYSANTFVEINSIGDPIYEMLLNKVGANFLQPFLTTSKSKQDIIEQLAVANQNKQCSFLPIDWLKKEFDVFTFEYNPKTKSIKYSAPAGFHDDGIMATAIGYEALKKLKIKGQYSLG